ncbi:Transcription factor, fungi, partial [Metarhizium majus ARSEF 297]
MYASSSFSTSATTPADPACSVAVYGALALAQRRRAEKTPLIPGLEYCAWEFINCSIKDITSVLLGSVSLLSVQALLTVCLFFQGTANPQPLFALSASAVRLACSIGMHRPYSGQLLASGEREQRMRVFWIAIILDAYATAKTGRPPSINMSDIGVPLPPAFSKDNLGMLINGKGDRALNFLLIKSKLSVLQGRMYDLLFSASALRKTAKARKESITQLDAELVRISHDMPNAAELVASDWKPPEMNQILGLLLTFHCIVITMQSLDWHSHWKTTPGSTDTNFGADDDGSQSPLGDKCLQSAYDTSTLLPLVSAGSTSFIW